MKTKKIVADSMPQALKKVRQQLGDNAIIVNTKTIKKGGLFGLFGTQKYEVTAYSVEVEEEPAHPKYIIERKKIQPPQPPKPVTQPAANQPAVRPPVSHPNVQQDSAKAPMNPPGGNQTGTGSGFHHKPQNLYSYYAQNAQPAEAPAAKEAPEEAISSAAAAELAAAGSDSEFLPLDMGKAALESAPALEASNMPEPPPASASQPAGLPTKDDAVLDELQQMRKMMMTLMMNERGGTPLPEGISKWVNRLKKQGVDEEVREHIIDRLMKKVDLDAEPNEALLQTEIKAIITDILKQRIPETNTVSEGTRMINIIGPTGVGKTTTIAKLATEQVLKQKRRVAMVTTDVYRIAAVEQLKTYAGILNVPFEVVRSPEELIRVLENLKHYDLIYMDTTGRNYKELEYRESINGYLDHSFQSDNYLVLSMTTKWEDMEVLLDDFLDSPIKKLILTKWDETSSYGSIVNIAYKYPYEIAYITNGQSVPEDIMTVDAAMLASKIAGEDN
ncbi:flagellar biosynthesis protein FlhF [Neobacillus muris]|uniref:flagellar biosynthesis protein FlhF n=1 Tax=Neobacillus muris TaxID=2941334 RepID=UPI00203B4D75|nr:flagellar biosynthesis protein FlhF [Neobacillus muris]